MTGSETESNIPLNGVRRVFLSHTSELAQQPAGRTFVDAAMAGIRRAQALVDDMSSWTAGQGSSAQECADRVARADVYVGLIGFRYGSPVRDRPDVSYTEHEYETAKDHGLQLRVFALSDEASLPRSALVDAD